MAVTIECPTCTRRINVPVAASGKKVKCPGCEGYMTVPVLDDPGYEVEPERPARSRRMLADEPRPRRRHINEDDFDDDDGPRRRRRHVDEDDYKNDGHRGTHSQTQALLLYGGGGLAAVLVLVGSLWAFGAFGKKASGGTAADSGTSAPPGWAKVDDPEFNAFMPGEPKRKAGAHGNHTHNGVLVEVAGQPPQGTTQQATWTAKLNQTEFTLLTRTYIDKTVGVSEEFLLDEAAKCLPYHFLFGREDKKSDFAACSMTTMIGKPCLEVKYVQPDTFGHLAPYVSPNFGNPAANDSHRRSHEQSQQRFLRDRKHWVMRVVADGKRVFVLLVQSTGEEPSADMLKTFYDSLSPK
jgi:hypothetical protein